MTKIHILDKAVAELIAAGEVVERPASIAKELIENSIDAGATDISVEISGGGITLLRISDNGCGIAREDIPKAFLRHATSKVETAGDLDEIMTLGFRGEALASIAAMCKVELLTKTADEAEGTSYTVEGGEYKSSVPKARPTGTTITVRDVFFNTPARMKFLKRDISEGNSVAQVVDKCALSHPEIAFKLIRDGNVKLKTYGNGDLLSVIYAIYGREFAEEMLPVDYVYQNMIGVTGFISKPKAVKPSRSYQTFFINGRFIKTRTGGAALEEAYKNKIMHGKFPSCFLNLELDAKTIDVNVHPAKLEVRFVNEKPVFSAVYYAVKSALASLESPVHAKLVNVLPLQDVQKNPEQMKLSAQEFCKMYEDDGKKQDCKDKQHYNYITTIASEKESEIIYTQTETVKGFANKPLAMNSPRSAMLDISVDDDEVDFDNKNYTKFSYQSGFDKKIPAENDNLNKILYKPATNEQTIATNMVETKNVYNYRFIGECFGTYIIFEEDGELVLVDKHAAHERILYEKLKQELSYGNRQVLLTPQSVTLLKEEHSALLENMNETLKLGFLIEDFGGSAVVVREVPIELSETDIAYILRELADKLKNNRRDLTPHVLDRLYYSIACRSAVKANDKSSGPELEEIIKQLRENPGITHCPHGRPVSIRMTRREIEKMFGRLG